MKGIVAFLVCSVVLLTAAFACKPVLALQGYLIVGALLCVNVGMMWHVTRK